MIEQISREGKDIKETNTNATKIIDEAKDMLEKGDSNHAVSSLN